LYPYKFILAEFTHSASTISVQKAYNLHLQLLRFPYRKYTIYTFSFYDSRTGSIQFH